MIIRKNTNPSLSKISPLKMPPIGETEQVLKVAVSPIIGTAESAWLDLKDYEIKDTGIGLEAVTEIIGIIFERKFGLEKPDDSKNFQIRLLTVEAECKLIDRPNNNPFRNYNPKKLNKVLRNLTKDWSKHRLKGIRELSEMDLSDIVPPLFVSSKVLNMLTDKPLPRDILMIDGARRLMAGAFQGLESIKVKVIVLPDEYADLLGTSAQKQLQKKVKSLSWFPKYHTIDTVNLQGSRSMSRLQLIDFNSFRDCSVIDFGCSLGQMSISAAESGASKVLGVEGMPDTIEVARSIKDSIGLSNLKYLQVDFNSQDFDTQIDNVFPDEADYTFFFSVYRTKELTQRDRLFDYILKKTKIACYFEGHADPEIDTDEYYQNLFERFGVTGSFLGFSEDGLRPLYCLKKKS